MRIHSLLVLVTLLFGASARGQPGASGLPEPVARWQYGRAMIHCYSPFWVSLHHVLWAHAFVDATEAPGGADWAVPDELREHDAWRSAVAWYRENLKGRDFGRDRLMRELDLALVGIDIDAPPVLTSAPDLAAQLAAVAPHYRRLAWPAHDAQARAGVALLGPLNARFGEAMARRLAETFGVPWPEGPIVVLFLPYANWAGAYTTFPPCIRLSPDPRQGDAVGRFESLWHEASHLLDGLEGNLRTPFDDAAEELGVEAPFALAHAALFYNCAELVREVGAADASYESYMVRNGLWKGDWAAARTPIETHWPRYLRGEITLDEAARAIVAGLEGGSE